MSIEIEVKTQEINDDDRLYDYVSSKTEKLGKYLHDISNARVELTHSKTARQITDRFSTQITIWGKGFTLRSEERASDVFASFDAALEKIQRRIERYKGKRMRGRGDGTSVAEDALKAMGVEDAEPENPPIIARRKKFTLIPMNEMEAIEQSNLLGHEDFFVFFNMDTNSVNVLYRRRDNDYGLIETEIG
ncbi:MAG: ribosome-associated translation inhibitor RaiA [Anaerolineae bacterium]|nr:ribosome-associated translation inhibitor RaiA [Anaerolineae bacterium]